MNQGFAVRLIPVVRASKSVCWPGDDRQGIDLVTRRCRKAAAAFWQQAPAHRFLPPCGSHCEAPRIARWPTAGRVPSPEFRTNAWNVYRKEFEETIFQET